VEELFDSMSSEEFDQMLPLELSEDDDCVPGTRASSSVRLFAATSSLATISICLNKYLVFIKMYFIFIKYNVLAERKKLNSDLFSLTIINNNNNKRY